MTEPARGTLVLGVDVDAPPESVWALVSDLPGMGALSPENTGGHWLDGAARAAVGARFRGHNRRDWRRWSTVATVTRCDPGRALVFDVHSHGLAVATWGYEVLPRPGGCRVVETWLDRRGRIMKVLGRLATGVADRQQVAREGLEHTLAAVRRHAEAASVSSVRAAKADPGPPLAVEPIGVENPYTR